MENKDYILPFRVRKGQKVVISQGWHGPYSHFRHKPADNTYAIDFVLPLNTEVIASHEGEVLSLIDVIPIQQSLLKIYLELTQILQVIL